MCGVWPERRVMCGAWPEKGIVQRVPSFFRHTDKVWIVINGVINTAILFLSYVSAWNSAGSF